MKSLLNMVNKSFQLPTAIEHAKRSLHLAELDALTAAREFEQKEGELRIAEARVERLRQYVKSNGGTNGTPI